MLPHYEADGENVLSWVNTGDEVWIHHFELQTKRQSVELQHPTSIWKHFKSSPSGPKVIATAIWNAEGVILVDMPQKNIASAIFTLMDDDDDDPVLYWVYWDFFWLLQNRIRNFLSFSNLLKFLYLAFYMLRSFLDLSELILSLC